MCIKFSRCENSHPVLQTNTSDKERQFYADTEKLLQAQKAKSAASYDRMLLSNQELVKENERLQRRVSELKAAHAPVISPKAVKSPSGGAVETNVYDEEEQPNTRGSTPDPATSSRKFATVHDESGEAELKSLQTEYASLLTSHSSLTATMQQLQAELRDVKSTNAELRHQNETFVDILQEKTINGELVSGSAVLNRRYSLGARESDLSSDASTTETSDVDDVPDVPKAKVNTSRKQVSKQVSSEALRSTPHDLASELEHSSETLEGKKTERKRERSEMLSEDIQELHKEIWELRDANQALTLYVNKILDRIIAREGYENVLAIDADQKRTLRAKTSRMQEKSSRALTSEQDKQEGDPSTHETDPRTPKLDTTVHSAARRTASIDWRSFLPAVGGSSPSISQGEEQSARRIRSSEEVEDKQDEQERERIRQSLQRQGFVLPEHQLRSQKRASTSFGTFFSRVIGGANNNQDVLPEHTQALHSITDDVSSLDQSTSASSEEASPTLTRQSLRQRALEADRPSSNLTELPARTARLSRKSLTPESSREDMSRGDSEAGDESYGYTNDAVHTADAETDPREEAGWRKALKRMSLLSTPTNANAPTSNTPHTHDDANQ